MNDKLGLALFAVLAMLVGVAVYFGQPTVPVNRIGPTRMYIVLMVLGALSLGFLLIRNWVTA